MIVAFERNGVVWALLRPDMKREALGHLPEFLHNDNPHNAVTQFHNAYGHGGGWNKFEGFSFDPNHENGPTLTYQGDPPYHAVAAAKLRDEIIHVYPHAWVQVIQPDGTWEVARMD